MVAGAPSPKGETKAYSKGVDAVVGKLPPKSETKAYSKGIDAVAGAPPPKSETKAYSKGVDAAAGDSPPQGEMKINRLPKGETKAVVKTTSLKIPDSHDILGSQTRTPFSRVAKPQSPHQVVESDVLRSRSPNTEWNKAKPEPAQQATINTSQLDKPKTQRKNTEIKTSLIDKPKNPKHLHVPDTQVIERLQAAVQTLLTKQKASESPETNNRQDDHTAKPTIIERQVVVKPATRIQAKAPSAFWERRYLGRIIHIHSVR